MDTLFFYYFKAFYGHSVFVKENKVVNLEKLEKGMLVATAKVKNPEDIESDSPSFCLQFIR